MATVRTEKLPLLYVKLMQGPRGAHHDYARALVEFEAIAPHVPLTHLAELKGVGDAMRGWRQKASAEAAP